MGNNVYKWSAHHSAGLEKVPSVWLFAN